MIRMLVIAAAVAIALAIPAAARAHGGHVHKVMGTISSVEDGRLMVKTTDGKSVTVVVNTKTRITQGKTTLTSAGVKVGDRVVASGAQEKDILTAASIQVGTAPAAAAKK